MNDASEAWKQNDSSKIAENLSPAIERSIQVYIEWKNSLNAILEKNRLGLADPTLSGGPREADQLSRGEYFSLMHMMSQGLEKDVDAAAKNGIQALRNSIASTGTPVQLTDRKRGQNILTDLTIQPMGSAETLSRFGIVLGPEFRTEYRDAVAGKALGIDGRPLMQPGDTAADWERVPMKALEFFTRSTSVTHTPEMQKFVEALDFYFAPKNAKLHPGVAPQMSEQDTRSILHMIVQGLMESQTLAAKGVEQRTHLREDVNFGAKVEEAAGNVWEYLKDFREHPVGSALVGLVGIIAVRKMWNFIFPEKGKENPRWMVWTGWALLGGTAITLYQKNTQGTSWFDSLFNMSKKQLEDWKLKEKSLPPEKQTLPNYWAMECGMTNEQKKQCLSIIENQNARTVLDWYGRMKQAKESGEDIRKRPDLKLPFSVSKYQQLFGDKDKNEIAGIFYESLTDFFKNRGVAAQNGRVPYVAPNAANDAATIGYNYVRQRYLDHACFHAMAMDIIKPVEVKIGANIVDVLNNEAEWEKQKNTIRQALGNEELFFRLAVARSLYRRETLQKDDCKMDMSTIFLFEADPALMRKFGGGQAANIMETLYKGAREKADSMQRRFMNMAGYVWEVTTLENGMWLARAAGENIVYAWSKTGEWIYQTGLFLGEKINGPDPRTITPGNRVPAVNPGNQNNAPNNAPLPTNSTSAPNNAPLPTQNQNHSAPNNAPPPATYPGPT
jgi:hypothetical protein